MGKLAAENYSGLPLCSSKRLQLRWQDLKSNSMAASDDGGGTVVAERGVNIALCMLEGSSIPEQGEDMAASEDGRGAAVAEALAEKDCCWAAAGNDCSRGAAEARWAAAGKGCSGGAAEAGFEQRACLNVAGQ